MRSANMSVIVHAVVECMAVHCIGEGAVGDAFVVRLKMMIKGKSL